MTAALHAIRLEQVRAELSHSAKSASVAEISRYYGFTNAGRFAAAYRRRFGESPVETAGRRLISGEASEAMSASGSARPEAEGPLSIARAGPWNKDKVVGQHLAQGRVEEIRSLETSRTRTSARNDVEQRSSSLARIGATVMMACRRSRGQFLDSGQAKRNRTAALQLLKRIPDLGIIGPLASSCNTALTVGRKREAHSCLPSMALRG